MCWPCHQHRVITGAWPCRPARWQPGCPRGVASRYRPARAQGTPATTTGPGWPSSPAGPATVVLDRRSPTHPRTGPFYRCYSPRHGPPSPAWSRSRDPGGPTAGELPARHRGLTGLDEHQGRPLGLPGHRWTPPLACSPWRFLSIRRATEHTWPPRPPPGQIPLTPQRNRHSLPARWSSSRRETPAPAAMVCLAAAPAAPRQNLPLPAAARQL